MIINKEHELYDLVLETILDAGTIVEEFHVKHSTIHHRKVYTFTESDLKYATELKELVGKSFSVEFDWDSEEGIYDYSISEIIEVVKKEVVSYEWFEKED